MNKIRSLSAAFTLLFVLLAAVFAVPALANSPVPPWLSVKTEDAPYDLELWVTVGEGEGQKTVESSKIDKAFAFYYRSEESEKAVLHAKTGGREYEFDVTDDMLKNDALLSFKSGTPELTALPSRVWGRLAADFLVTVALELIVMLLFGYRKPRSFIIALIANVITQAAYHAWLEFVFYAKGLDFLWIIAAEAAVILVEGLIYMFAFREKTKSRSWCCAFVANVVSAYLGTLILLIIRQL